MFSSASNTDQIPALQVSPKNVDLEKTGEFDPFKNRQVKKPST